MTICSKLLKDFRRIPKSMKILTLGFFFYEFGWAFVGPFMPLYFKSITVSFTEVGLLFAILPLIHVFTSMPLGELSDKIGRKCIIMFAFLNYIIIGPVYAFLSNIWTLVLVRFYNALTATLVWVPHAAFMRDLSPKRKEAEVIGYNVTILKVAGIAGNIIGAFLLFYWLEDISLMFLALPVTSLMAFLVVSKVPETVKKRVGLGKGLREVEKDGFKKFKEELRDKRLALIAFLNTYGISTVGMVLALFARSMGANLLEIGLIYAVYKLPFTVQFVTGDLADRYGDKKMLVLGTSLTTVFFFLLYSVTHIATLFVITLFIALGVSIVSPVLGAYITGLGRGHEGETSGFYNSVTSVAAFIAPITAGVLSDLFSLNVPFLVCSMMFFVATCVALTFKN